MDLRTVPTESPTADSHGRAALHAPSVARDPATVPGSDSRWRQMVEAMPQVLWEARVDGCITYANRSWMEPEGESAFPPGEQAWTRLIHPQDREPYLARWHAALASGKMFEAEYRIRLPHAGAYRWHLARALPMRDAEGAIMRWLGTSTDIDDQKHAERAQRTSRAALEQQVSELAGELRRANEILRSVIAGREQAVMAERMSEARFSNVFRLSPDAMSISCGVQGPLLDVNERWQQLFGYRRADVIGKSARQLSLYACGPGDASISDRSQDPDVVRDLAVKMRTSGGAMLDTIVSWVRIDCGGVNCFITIVRDVTEQRQRESEAQQQREQLTYLTRVVVLGELSGALAHELNQPLAAILTNAQAARRFLHREPADLHEIGEILDDIVDEDKRAGEVIRRVRALFMKGDPLLQRLDINELVRDALALTNSTLIERKVPVILELGGSLGLIEGDRVQLQQVLLNLIVNACEAMSATAVRARRLGLLTASDGDNAVQILVTDTGPGIAPDAIDRLFDSFFTTKAYGLGFGLSITRAIIVEHGGRIAAANRPEGGAVFRITLPLARGAPS